MAKKSKKPKNDHKILQVTPDQLGVCLHCDLIAVIGCWINELCDEVESGATSEEDGYARMENIVTSVLAATAEVIITQSKPHHRGAAITAAMLELISLLKKAPVDYEGESDAKKSKLPNGKFVTHPKGGHA